jgi:hypothetical protein
MRIQVQMKVRTLQDIEANAQACVQVLEGELAPSIEKAAPLLQQVFFDFKYLKVGQLIMGCASQDEWSQQYLQKTARAVRYMFKGGNAGNMRQSRSLARAEGSREESGRKTFSVLPNSELHGMETQIASAGSAEQVLEISEPIVLTDVRVKTLEDQLQVQNFELQKVTAKLQARRQWILDLQSLTRELAPKDSAWSVLTPEQREQWEKLVEAQP